MRQAFPKIYEALEKQLQKLPTSDIASQSWAGFGEILFADSLKEAADAANDWAPEHLEIITQNKSELLGMLKNYGSLFIGRSSAEVFGDYVSGTNHTLPTFKAARYTGGVWAGTFLKVSAWQELSDDAMHSLSHLTSEMARGEGLIAHARAAEIRAEKIKI